MVVVGAHAGGRVAVSRGAAAGQPERYERVVAVVDRHDAEGFGGCTDIGEWTVACPQEIPLDVISTLDRDYLLATTGRRRRHSA